MAGAFEDVMRHFKLPVCCVENVAAMLRGPRTQFLTRLTDVSLGAVIAKEDINHVFRFAIHGLLNGKYFAILHFNAITLDNVVAALTVMTGIVALGNFVLFLNQREIRVGKQKFQVRRLTAAGNKIVIVHDRFHLGTLI